MGKGILLVAVILIGCTGQADQEGPTNWSKETIEAAAKIKSFYDGFENKEVFFKYIHDQAMIPTKNRAEIEVAVNDIPVNLKAPISLDQERRLREFVLDFVIAYGKPENDEYIEFSHKYFPLQPDTLLKLVQDRLSPEGVTSDEMGTTLDEVIVFMKESFPRKYAFHAVSFHDSMIRISKLQPGTDSFLQFAQDNRMLPRGYGSLYAKRSKADAERSMMKYEAIIAADFIIIGEEPPEFAQFSWLGRVPIFFRIWFDPDNNMWRPMEFFYSPGVPIFVLLF